MLLRRRLTRRHAQVGTASSLRALRYCRCVYQDDGHRTLKDISDPVQTIFEFLNDTIGSTFTQATNASNVNLLGLDLSEWGGGRNFGMQRNRMPWEMMKRENMGARDYWAFHVEMHIARLHPWHRWND
eukprot:2612722-Pleurochrysis_carterae.AAC.1